MIGYAKLPSSCWASPQSSSFCRTVFASIRKSNANGSDSCNVDSLLSSQVSGSILPLAQQVQEMIQDSCASEHTAGADWADRCGLHCGRSA